MKRGIWWVGCLVCGSASAQEGVRFHYFAPPECPSEQQFRERVRARLLGDPLASDAARSERGDSPVSVEVRLEPCQHRATLLLKEPGSEPVERVVAGDSCEELVSGLALITALAFGAAREPATATESPPVPAAEAPATAPAAAVASPLEPPLPAKSLQATVSEPASSSASSRAASSPALALEIGAGGWLNTWSAPNGGLGADLFLRVAPKAPSWSLRASGLYGFRVSSVGERVAEFRFVGGRVEGCPLVRNVQRWLSGEACLGLELGALSGRGRDSSALLVAGSDTVFSATALITGRTRARFGKRFFLEGQGDLGLPLVRHEFVFEQPSEQIFRTPVLGFSARLGLGVQFP
jgi:hypothetical protein